MYKLDMDDFVDSDTDEDYRAELSDEILLEIEEDRKTRIIRKFKDYVQNIPEFSCIYNISSYSILDIIESKHEISKEKKILDPLIYDVFDDLFVSMYGTVGNYLEYNYIFKKIYNKLYI
tara:strand:- start:3245 stop:3601 length:357 start_codon:yes stop_codon:yes gene_type:complete